MQKNAVDPPEKSPNNRAKMIECFRITRETRRKLVLDKANSVEYIFEKYPLILHMPAAVTRISHYLLLI